MSTKHSRPAAGVGDTRERLLRAARSLITVHGVEGVSIRGINAAAGASPGSLHYHFGSRESLLVALISEYIEPLMRERQQLLALCEARGPLGVREIAEVMVMPLARTAIEGGEDGMAHVCLLARLYGDRNEILFNYTGEPWMRAIYERQFTALKHCRPGVPEAELMLRLDLSTHCMLRGLSALREEGADWQLGSGYRGFDPWERVEAILRFVAAGLQA
ncbi:TetR/AcrR family transcriptional regulator [Haliea atlantica]